MPFGKFHHFGVPTRTRQPNETYIAPAKVFVTDPEAHPFKVEFVRMEDDSPLPAELRNHSHAAFMVDDLEAAMKGYRVVVAPFDATDTLRAAFIMDGEALIELMQQRKSSCQ